MERFEVKDEDFTEVKHLKQVFILKRGIDLFLNFPRHLFNDTEMFDKTSDDLILDKKDRVVEILEFYRTFCL